jgi:hypothetical protein
MRMQTVPDIPWFPEIAVKVVSYEARGFRRADHLRAAFRKNVITRPVTRGDILDKSGA